MSLESLGICQAAELLRQGKHSSLDLVNDCLARVDEFDPAIQAWAWIDPEHARRQAESLDQFRRQGKPVGRLHGIPIGIKDIIDTTMIPTEHGSELFKGRLPKEDAPLIARLRAEGAIIMGKTVTASLATFMPGKTCNPHNHEHTPGGSSSGSAAAVASFMTAGAVGSQTIGSVIRPAAYCGTIGYKPSFGLIPRTGVLPQSGFLDQIGVFGRHVEDVALLAEVMMGGDSQDDDSIRQIAPPQLQSVCQSEPPLTPKFGFVKTAAWEQTDSATRAGFEEVSQALDKQIQEVELPPAFDAVWTHLQTVHEAEMAHHFAPIYAEAKQFLDDIVIQQIERGQKISVTEYLSAQQQRQTLLSLLDEVFDEYDALITPSAAGEAPKGLQSTGSPEFCATWNFCGVPSITLPLLRGENDLPIGVQVIGGYLDDGRLLRSARWLNRFLQEESLNT